MAVLPAQTAPGLQPRAPQSTNNIFNAIERTEKMQQEEKYKKFPYKRVIENAGRKVGYTMRKNLPKTLDQLIFCKYTLVFSKCSQIY